MRYNGGVQDAIQELGRTFSENPHIFLTEADVQCYLYSILLKNHYFSNPGRAKVTGKPDKILNKNGNTIRLHAEILSNSRQKFCDLSIIKLRDIKFEAREPRDSKSSSYEDRLLHTHKYGVNLSEATGIEIKFNWGWYTRAQVKNKRKEMAWWIVEDLKKLMKGERNEFC